MTCPTRNPRSEELRGCLCDDHAARYMLGQRDIATLEGTIRHLDAKLADCEAERDALQAALDEHCHHGKRNGRRRKPAAEPE